MQAYAEKIYVLVHRCHEQCLKLMRTSQPDSTFREIGLSTRQGIILKFLLAEDGLTQKEVTERLGITSSSCGELIVKLEQGGYLKRRPNPADKRTYTMHLTESGRGLAEYYQEKCVIELEDWASDLTQQEKEQLFQLLAKLSQGLEDQISKTETTL